MVVEVLVLQDDSRPACEWLRVFNQEWVYLMPVDRRPLCVPVVVWLHPWVADHTEYADGRDTYVYEPDFGWCRQETTQNLDDVLGEGLLWWFEETTPRNGLWQITYTHEHGAWRETESALVIPLPTPNIAD